MSYDREAICPQCGMKGAHFPSTCLSIQLKSATTKLVEAERERELVRNDLSLTRQERDDANARAERFRAALGVIVAREWDKGRDRSVQIALAALADSPAAESEKEAIGDDSPLRRHCMPKTEKEGP